MRTMMSDLSPWCVCAFALERRPFPTVEACRRVPTEGDDDGSDADFFHNAEIQTGTLPSLPLVTRRHYSAV